MSTCDQHHAAPSCADPACYREENARKADEILPGLGDLVRQGLLDPNQPRSGDYLDTDRYSEPDRLWPPLETFRALDPVDMRTPDRLTDEELIAWAERSGIFKPSMEGSNLRLLVDEVCERRAAEAAFAEIDQRYQALECDACAAQAPRFCAEHAMLAWEWNRAREDFLDQMRIHRGYLADFFKKAT